MNEDIQAPTKGVSPSSCEILFPKVLMKWKVIKINTANTIGSPIPPFRIMAPNGAPMKNIKKQAKAITNFS